MISVTQEDVKIFTVNIVNRTFQKEVYSIGLYLKMEPQPTPKTHCFNYNGTCLRPPQFRSFPAKHARIEKLQSFP
jgi:hypothetical protein